MEPTDTEEAYLLIHLEDYQKQKMTAVSVTVLLLSY
jgi:hypothetical protein